MIDYCIVSSGNGMEFSKIDEGLLREKLLVMAIL